MGACGSTNNQGGEQLGSARPAPQQQSQQGRQQQGPSYAEKEAIRRQAMDAKFGPGGSGRPKRVSNAKASLKESNLAVMNAETKKSQHVSPSANADAYGSATFHTRG